MPEIKDELPKVIWFLWIQGFDEMPRIVKKCYYSWLDYNKEWEVIFLNKENIGSFLDLDEKLSFLKGSMTPQAYSDILRINLLSKYGGVWVDATCFCCKPLDEWIYEYLKTGFFAFQNPGRDRMIASWFLVSKGNNYISVRLCMAVNQYWSQNKKIKLVNKTVFSKVYNKIAGTGISIWFSFLFTKVFKVHPYFWFHYLFAKVYNEDGRFKELWDSTAGFEAAAPLKLVTTGLQNAIPCDIKDEIDRTKTPIYKLFWELKYEAGSTLDYLINRKKSQDNA